MWSIDKQKENMKASLNLDFGIASKREDDIYSIR